MCRQPHKTPSHLVWADLSDSNIVNQNSEDERFLSSAAVHKMFKSTSAESLTNPISPFLLTLNHTAAHQQLPAENTSSLGANSGCETAELLMTEASKHIPKPAESDNSIITEFYDPSKRNRRDVLINNNTFQPWLLKFSASWISKMNDCCFSFKFLDSSTNKKAVLKIILSDSDIWYYIQMIKWWQD